MDALKFTAAFLAIILPFLFAALREKRMWIWFYFWIGPIICGFGATEAISYFRLEGMLKYLVVGFAGTLMAFWYLIIGNQSKEKTISRVFWEFKEKYPLYALFCILGMIGFWAYLCLHLWFRW